MVCWRSSYFVSPARWRGRKAPLVLVKIWYFLRMFLPELLIIGFSRAKYICPKQLFAENPS